MQETNKSLISVKQDFKSKNPKILRNAHHLNMHN